MTNDNEDPFDGYEPLAGVEHLGRHIVDAQGQPSGSPANFEYLRGRGLEPPTAEETAVATAAIATEFAADKPAPPEAHPWASEAKDE